MFCVDDDDTRDYDVPGAEIIRGPRPSASPCITWTNTVAMERASRYRVLASLGDDHEPQPPKKPRDPAFDEALLAAIDKLGGTGVAYGDDTLQGWRLPTAFFVSSDIVQAFGFLMFDRVGWYYCDDWIRDVAAPDLLAYVPQVVIKHYHYMFGTAPRDSLNAAAEQHWNADRAIYEAYRRDPAGLEADRKKLRSL